MNAARRERAGHDGGRSGGRTSVDAGDLPAAGNEERGDGTRGRVALVTAGSKGIGRATALRLAQDGADVAISYAHDEAAAADCVAAIEALGRRAFALRAPAEDLEAGERLVARTIEALGPIGILVNNAGVDWDGTPVAQTPPDRLTRVMAINAIAPTTSLASSCRACAGSPAATS